MAVRAGAGKTTLAVNLAVAAYLDGSPSIVLDTDPQGSARVWREQREARLPVVVSVAPGRMGHYLDRARANGARLALIDTAPHAEAPALEAARAADFVLIPCRPSIFDVRAVAASFSIAEMAGTPALGMLWAVPSSSSLGGQALEAFRRRRLRVGRGTGQRTAYAHAATAGLGVQEYQPKSAAAQEMTALYDSLKPVLSKPPRQKWAA